MFGTCDLTVVELRFGVVEKTLDRSDVAADQFQSGRDAVQRMGLSASVRRTPVHGRPAGRAFAAERGHRESLDEDERW